MASSLLSTFQANHPAPMTFPICRKNCDYTSEDHTQEGTIPCPPFDADQIVQDFLAANPAFALQSGCVNPDHDCCRALFYYTATSGGCYVDRRYKDCIKDRNGLARQIVDGTAVPVLESSLP